MKALYQNGIQRNCLAMSVVDLDIYFYFYRKKQSKKISMPLKINVAYSEKDIAKSKGAFWDAEQRTWFVPDHKDINNFLQWIDTKKVSTIAKSTFITVNRKQCYKCEENTIVIALASDDFYYLNYDENDKEKWFQTLDFSFFSMPIYIDNEMTSLLNGLFPQFKMGYSRTIGGKYWANHCEYCGALQGDFHMHSEPGGAFCPIEIEECKELTLIPVNTNFYVELNADTSWASNSDEILYFAHSINLQEFLSLRNTATSSISISRSNDVTFPKNTLKFIYWILAKVKSFFS